MRSADVHTRLHEIEAGIREADSRLLAIQAERERHAFDAAAGDAGAKAAVEALAGERTALASHREILTHAKAEAGRRLEAAHVVERHAAHCRRCKAARAAIKVVQGAAAGADAALKEAADALKTHDTALDVLRDIGTNQIVDTDMLYAMQASVAGNIPNALSAVDWPGSQRGSTTQSFSERAARLTLNARDAAHADEAG